MSNEPLADVRDMYLAHTMFRREIGLAPTLLRGVADGDVDRAAVIADHIQIVDNGLYHHHAAEDRHLWPRLVERAGDEAAPVVRVMEEQHSTIDKLLNKVRAGLAEWRVTADATAGAVLADRTAELYEQLCEHLAIEESRALPLIERHITAAEWGHMIADGAGDADPAQIALIFGMMAYEAEPDTVRDIIAQMPPEVSSAIGDLAAQAYAAHAQRVYGTATPARIGTEAQ